MTIATELRDEAGLAAVEYLRPPQGIGVENFTISVEGRRLRYWHGTNAEVTIYGDRKHKQAVLIVREPGRRITRKVKVWRNRLGPDQSSFTPEDREFLWAFQSEVRLPNATYDVSKTKTWKRGVSSGYGRLSKEERARFERDYCEGEVTATVRGSTVTFLVGRDEAAYFIAMLPKRVESVEAAHELLRPNNVPKGSLRQGEWFFVPATSQELSAIQTSLERRSSVPRFVELEPGSSHHALTATAGQTRFAIGIVTDSRKDHHKPLTLHNWHRVVRNREVTAPSASRAVAQRRVRWD